MPRAPLTRLAAAVACLLVLACSCAEDSRFDSPAVTWQTYTRAVAAGDAATAWECLAASHQAQEYGGDPARWERELREHGAAMERACQRREIADERLLSQRLAYLLFDAGTLESENTSPFVYFLRDRTGWKMTTHLDTVFHRELEQAIARGEFRLPKP